MFNSRFYHFVFCFIAVASFVAASAQAQTDAYALHQGKDPHGLSFEVPASWILDEESTSPNKTEWFVSYEAPSQDATQEGWIFPTCWDVEGEDCGRSVTAEQYLREMAEEMSEIDEELGLGVKVEIVGDKLIEGIRITLTDEAGTPIQSAYGEVSYVSNGHIDMLRIDASQLALLGDEDFEVLFGSTPIVTSYIFSKGSWIYAATAQTLEKDYEQYANELEHLANSLHFTK